MKNIRIHLDAYLLYANPEHDEKKMDFIVPHFSFHASIPNGAIQIVLSGPSINHTIFNHAQSISYSSKGIDLRRLPDNEVQFIIEAEHTMSTQKWDTRVMGNDKFMLHVRLPATEKRDRLNFFIPVTDEDLIKLKDCDELTITNGGLKFH